MVNKWSDHIQIKTRERKKSAHLLRGVEGCGAGRGAVGDGARRGASDQQLVGEAAQVGRECPNQGAATRASAVRIL